MKIQEGKQSSFSQLHKYVSENIIGCIKNFCDTLEAKHYQKFSNLDFVNYCINTSVIYDLTIEDVNTCLNIIKKYWAFDSEYLSIKTHPQLI